MKKYYSINELEEQTGIPGTTIRRYIQKFPDFFMVKGGNRGKRYEETAIKVLVRIKNLFDDGYETDGVDDFLRNEFPTVVDVDEKGNVEEKGTKDNAPTLVTKEDIVEIKQALQEQKEFNKLLVEKLDQQQQYIDNRLNERDNLLLKAIDERLETQKQIAASEENAKQSSKKRKWWNPSSW